MTKTMIPFAIAAGGLILAGVALRSRAARADQNPPPRLLRDHPRSESVERPGKDSPEPSDEERPEAAPTEPLDLLVTELVAGLKAAGSQHRVPDDLARFLMEMLKEFSSADVFERIGRQAPLEEGFAVLRQLVDESRTLREFVLQVVAATRADADTRLFALRLLPSFAHLRSDLERGALLRQFDHLPGGELGRQLIRYVGRSSEPEASASLSRLLGRCRESEARAEVLRALVRFPDPIAASTLNQCFADPETPISERALILRSLTAPEAAKAAYARYPWLPEVLERSLRIPSGDRFDAGRQELVSTAATILGQNRDLRRLSVLLEQEKDISEPAGRATIAFALRWLPGEESAATLAAMASNPEETPQVRRMALESLQGRKSAGIVQRLMTITSEPGVPRDVSAALESLLRE